MINSRNTRPVAPNANAVIITSIPSYKEWEKTVKVFRKESEAADSEHDGLRLIVRDDISHLLTPTQRADANLMERVNLYVALLDKKALNEARQSYLLNLKGELLNEVRSLKMDQNKKAHNLRIRAIEGEFVYEPAPMYKQDPRTRQLILDADGKPQPILSGNGEPVTRMSKVREEPKGGQTEGRFRMKQDGLVTEIIIEQTESLHPGWRKLNDMISVVKKSLEKEVGHPLKASMMERDDSLSDKFAELFGTTC